MGNATEGGGGGGGGEEGAGQGVQEIQLGSSRPDATGLTCAHSAAHSTLTLSVLVAHRDGAQGQEDYIMGVPIDFDNITKTCHPLQTSSTPGSRRGTRTRRPCQSSDGTLTKTSPTCTPAMLRLSSQGSCTSAQHSPPPSSTYYAHFQ